MVNRAGYERAGSDLDSAHHTGEQDWKGKAGLKGPRELGLERRSRAERGVV